MCLPRARMTASMRRAHWSMAPMMSYWLISLQQLMITRFQMLDVYYPFTINPLLQSTPDSVAVSNLDKTAPFFVTPKAKVNSCYEVGLLGRELLPDMRLKSGKWK